MAEPMVLGADYAAWLAELKTRIRGARLQASLAVNRELVCLYWRIGREILERQASQGWGSKVIQQLATDLRAEFPDMKGLSRTNLMYMRAFAEAWPEEAFVQQLAGQMPWFHNCTILDKLKDRPTREWYIKNTEFRFEYTGQLNGYLAAVDDLLRDPAHDAPTIGMILCKSKKTTMVEYALRGVQTPMGVSTYRTTPELPEDILALLPSIEALSAQLDLDLPPCIE